jgi:tetratricopeptide (TPR) repeat protein
MGRMREAERELLEEERLFPGRVEALAALSAVYAAAGRREDAIRTARRILASVPGPDGSAAAIRSLEAIGERAAATELRRQAAERFPNGPRFREHGRA